MEYREDLLNTTDTYSRQEMELQNLKVSSNKTGAEVAEAVKQLQSRSTPEVQRFTPNLSRIQKLQPALEYTPLQHCEVIRDSDPEVADCRGGLPLLEEGPEDMRQLREITFLSVPEQVYPRVVKRRVHLLI